MHVRRDSRLDLQMVVLGALSLALVLISSATLFDDSGEMLTRNTVRLSLAWYTAASA